MVESAKQMKESVRFLPTRCTQGTKRGIKSRSTYLILDTFAESIFMDTNLLTGSFLLYTIATAMFKIRMEITMAMKLPNSSPSEDAIVSNRFGLIDQSDVMIVWD